MMSSGEEMPSFDFEEYARLGRELERMGRKVTEWIESGHEGMTSIEAALDRGDLAVRRQLPDALRLSGHPRRLEWLLRLLDDEDGAVRLAAARSCAMCSPAFADDDRLCIAEAMIAALDDTEHGVRNFACQALGTYGDHRAITPLMAIVPTQGWSAIDALTRIGDPTAIAPLAAYYETLSDLGERTKVWSALSALGETNIPRPHRQGPGFEEVLFWLSGAVEQRGTARFRGFCIHAMLYGLDGRNAALSGTLELAIFANRDGARGEVFRRRVEVTETDYSPRYLEGLTFMFVVPTYSWEWPEAVVEVGTEESRATHPHSVELRFTTRDGQDARYQEDDVLFDFDHTKLRLEPPQDDEEWEIWPEPVSADP